MTDNKIIKALGKMKFGGHSCLECKHKKVKGDNRCGIKGCRIAQDALGLINRQKAEIERLQKLNDEIIDKLKCMTEENHKLACDKYENEIRVIKEFAERLKITDLSGVVGEHYINGEMYGYFDSGAFGGVVDNLVKEMVGDE